MYINQFDIYINGNFFVSGYLFYKFVRSLYNEKRRKEERNKKCCMKQESKVGYRDIFRQTEYMKIMIAALINRFGDSIDAIASTWIVYEITGNAAWSAIIYGVNRIPSIIITPLAGAWVEGQKKKTIMIVTDLIRAVCVAFVATGYLFGFLQAWMLLVTTLTISTVEAFRGPASAALTPKVLEKEYYEYGISLSTTLSSMVELIGTAVAAAIIAVIGTSGAIYVDMTTFLLSALIIVFVNTKEQGLVKQKFDRKTYVKDLADGFSYVKKDAIIRIFLLLAVFLNAILVPLNSLQAPLAGDILGGGAEILSILGISITVGMLLGSVTYPMVQRIISGKGLWIASGLGIALFYIMLPVCRPLYTSRILVCAFTAVFSFILGYTVALVNSHLSVFTVKRIRTDYLARISGITTAAGAASMPVASFLVSIVVAYVDTSAIFITSGVLALIVTVCMFFSRTLGQGETDTVAEDVEMVRS